MNKILAPWTKEQVYNLNYWQKYGQGHPFTCVHCRDNLGTNFIRLKNGKLRPLPKDFMFSQQGDKIVHLERELVATRKGWKCKTCDYKQDWAWDVMMEPMHENKLNQIAYKI
jgi:hypothetical protein